MTQPCCRQSTAADFKSRAARAPARLANDLGVLDRQVRRWEQGAEILLSVASRSTSMDSRSLRRP